MVANFTFVWMAVPVALVLLISWMLFYGAKRGIVAFLFRCTWVFPILAAFFPETTSVSIPNSLSVKTIHVLVDDSDSMKLNSREQLVNNSIQELRNLCKRFSCQVRLTYLSNLNPSTENGFSPIGDVFPSWIYSTAGEPWIFISDGGDQKPSDPWSESLKKVGVDRVTNKLNGLILGFGDRSEQNLWVELEELFVFAFEERTTALHAVVNRQVLDGELPFQVQVQVQVLSGDTHLASMNGIFRDGDEKIAIEIPLPPLNRGQTLLHLKALPIAGERQLWDNEASVYMDVLPNTVGLLHLLGSPSWDGRFIRRYLKSEPKFDLISFFILRDPIDLQLTNERELSLIPFPVDRLFNQELGNFQSVIIQNFSMYKFLEPSYQANLVEFVKSGGGLLFIGGPRALHSADLRNSPLSEIIPFEYKSDASKSERQQRPEFGMFGDISSPIDKLGPYYDPDLAYTIEIAKPNAQQRALANVYDDWLQLAPALSKQSQLRGLHHTENVQFKEGKSTPLLNARLENGESLPLAVASYPGKGRALWIFSDALWQVALNPSDGYSRELYNEFFSSGLTWLLRQEIRKSLIIKNFSLGQQGARKSFDLTIGGPAAAYLNIGGKWDFSVCGESFTLDKLLTDRRSVDDWFVSGLLKRKVNGGDRCRIEVKAEHPAFGSVQASIDALVPLSYSDVDITGSLVKLRQLSLRTGARLLLNEQAGVGELEEWLAEVTDKVGVSSSEQVRTIDDHYWFLNYWWFWLLCLALPLEIVVRRWPQIGGF